MKSVSKRLSAPVCVLLIVVASALSPAPVEADSKDAEGLTTGDLLGTGNAFPVQLSLVWYDNYRLLPLAFETMFQEVNRLFEEQGVRVHWVMGKEADKDENAIHDPLKCFVILIPSRPSSWGLKGSVMGVATHRDGMKGSAYIFFPQIVETLSLVDTKSPYARKYLARAIGRVVVHEIVHVLAPDYPHTDTGLMKRELRRRFLIQPKVHLDAVSARVVRTEIQALGNQILLASDDFGMELEAKGGRTSLLPAGVKEPPR